MKRFIGLDAGSVSVKLAVLDEENRILQTEYVRHRGDPFGVSLKLLSDQLDGSCVSITGSAGKIIASALGIRPVNEVVAISEATTTLYPEVRTVIEIGGEDSKLILLEDGSIKDFSMNSVCAAGTGSFLDQQAERLKLTIEEFGEIALKSKNPPRIAGRCSVFAKSDMIHLQQIATPVEDIVAGLCFAVARNFKGSICKNTELKRPVCFQGGVAANRGVLRAFREVMGIDDLIVPEYFALMPAIGAVIRDKKEGTLNPLDIKRLREYALSLKTEGTSHPPLCQDIESFRKRHTVSYEMHTPQDGHRVNAYLGIDVGSISTNLAVIDEQGRLLAKRYLMTAGRPIEAVKKGLEEIGEEIGDRVNICGVGTTGSGRYMIADFVGADIVKNEITAQAQAAIEIDPEVDTIFEIGGQDSKYISIKDRVIVDFEMNKACAAGTGSFIEEQAEKLNISVKGEFSDLAFKSKSPCALGERCTVFMENSLVSRQQRGAPRDDLVAGLAYSIVQNYLNRVVGDRRIGKKIFFQGGVAFNKAVVAAFESYLGREIIVPPHHDVTGAIGMAIIARKYMRDRYGSAVEGKTSFKGFDLSRRGYSIKSFECKECDNHCEINMVRVEGEKTPLYYGSRCEKYDVKRKMSLSSEIPDLFAERQELLYKSHKEYLQSFRNSNGQRPKIGIPMIFFFHDFLPFWSTFLWELGFQVEISGSTNRAIINKGIEHILSESCFPHKVAHGHIKELIDRGVDAIFLPSFINLSTNDIRSFACPYVQSMPYVAKAVFRDTEFISPVINFEKGDGYLLDQLHRLFKKFYITKKEIKDALKRSEIAQREFTSSIRRTGGEILEQLPERAIVIVGRSYNAFDGGMNLNIPKKLAGLGVLAIPMDFLPIDVIDISERWINMYWRSGQNILRAAEIIRENPNLYALYISNFSCGPDSFIHKYFSRSMSEKPFLHIEIDEHSADAGIITRCEAFLDSISSRSLRGITPPQRLPIVSLKRGSNHRVVYIPRMSDHAFAVEAAFRACGLEAEVMDEPDMESVRLGRKYVSGKECYPCAITTGDMIKKIKSPDFDRERAVFFMPSGAGPCRFGQYNILHRLVLNDIGMSGIPVYSPNQDGSFYSELGIVGRDFTRVAWKGIVAIDILMKCLHETRPYELNPGQSEELYSKYLQEIRSLLASGNGGSLIDLLTRMRDDFASIPRSDERRPLVGIVGEIFVRHNRFANENIIKKVEALGGEVWLAPIEEWLYYINAMALRKNIDKWKKDYLNRDTIKDILNTIITRRVQAKIERELSHPFEGVLKTLHEPSTKELLRNASSYIHDSFEGEAILSIGKSIDFINRGASGIISTMPFGCMPGTIVSALMKGLRQDTGIPCMSIAYDGVESTCSEIQIEAFMYQVHDCFRKK